MTNLLQEINGMGNVEKEVDIRNTQNVTIYQNSNSDEKNSTNHVQEETLEANLKFPSSIFDITKLHQKYWKKFCDKFYKYLSFSSDKNGTYKADKDSTLEDKYKTFCKFKVQNEERYHPKIHTLVKEEDLKYLKAMEEKLFTLKDRDELIPTLYYYVRTTQCTSRKIEHDIWVIKITNPRCKKIDYSQYKLDGTKNFDEGNEFWPNIRETMKSYVNEAMIRDMLDSESFDHYTKDYEIKKGEERDLFNPNPADKSTAFLVNKILEKETCCLNELLEELSTLLQDCPKYQVGFKEYHFRYRLFMAYECSLPEIKKMVDELPSPRDLQELAKLRERLIKDFYQTAIGKEWIMCMENEDGIKYITKYFLNHRKELTEGDEELFFYQLDKICIIEDVLKGNAKKYDLDIAYPDDWFTQNTSENTDVAPQEKDIPQGCTDAIKNVLCPTFTSAQKEVLNSREQIVKAAKTINLNRNVNVAMLMAVALEVNAIRPDTNTRDFIRTLIGMGVIKYSGDKAIGKMADVVNKKLHGYKRKGKEIPPLPANHRFWKETERVIGDKIFRAMTNK